MKNTNRKEINQKIIPFPNAMTREYKIHKVLDTLLTAATGAGLATILLCVLAFF